MGSRKLCKQKEDDVKNISEMSLTYQHPVYIEKVQFSSHQSCALSYRLKVC